GFASRPVRKNLAVHVSLSSFLHNVKELTHRRHRQKRHLEAKLPYSFKEQDTPSGCPAAYLPFQRSAEQWERNRSASSAWRVLIETFSSVNTLFSFFVLIRNSKTRNQIFISFQWFASKFAAVWRRAL
ncbi:hypothetical protein, partial [Devosia lucknowensis]|uniref:hypothetical protein n=1 Tax=Devosia lucknowensis TaxID=1096929 RepID=UPI001AECDFC2